MRKREKEKREEKSIEA